MILCRAEEYEEANTIMNNSVQNVLPKLGQLRSEVNALRTMWTTGKREVDTVIESLKSAMLPPTTRVDADCQTTQTTSDFGVQFVPTTTDADAQTVRCKPGPMLPNKPNCIFIASCVRRTWSRSSNRSSRWIVTPRLTTLH